MAQQLTAAQKLLLDAVDGALEEAFKNGCEYPPGTTVVPSIEGYPILESVNGADLRPQAKGVFKSAVAAFMASLEAVHDIGGAGQPGFDNGWINYDTTYNACGFYMDPFSRVFTRGLIKPSGVSASGQLFLLPSGYRPVRRELLTTTGYSGVAYVVCRIDVLPDGSVSLINPSSIAAGGWVCLDGLSWRAA